MSQPASWATMPVTESHTNDIIDYAIGWTWAAAPDHVAGTGHATGTGLFGFRVYRNVAGPQVLNVNEFSVFAAKIRFRVIVTNPTTVTNYTLPRLALELRCLSYASTNPLPTIGDHFFNSSKFGALSGVDNLLYPTVRGIQYEPESEADPSIWIITYTVSPKQTNGASSRPDTGDDPKKPNIDETPWSIGPDIVVDFTTEDFVLGLGKYVGSKTPAQMDAALANGTYAGQFGGTGAFEMVANSAGDPLESPPPMKVGAATIRINRSFEELPSGIADNINAAMEQVSTTGITINGISFSAYTCKLAGGTISNRRWKQSADWLPKQLHPFKWTYTQLGWTPPENKLATDVAVNYTRSVLPAYHYLPYIEVSIAIAQRDLGWGYALIDKGFREKKVNGKQKEITDFSAKQTHSRILVDGVEADTSSGTTNLKVLRLYQVLKTGTDLSTIFTAMMT